MQKSPDNTTVETESDAEKLSADAELHDAEELLAGFGSARQAPRQQVGSYGVVSPFLSDESTSPGRSGDAGAADTPSATEAEQTAGSRA